MDTKSRNTAYIWSPKSQPFPVSKIVIQNLQCVPIKACFVRFECNTPLHVVPNNNIIFGLILNTLH